VREIPLDPSARLPYLVWAFGIVYQTEEKERHDGIAERIGSGLLLMVLASLLTGCAALFVGAAAGSVAGALYYKGELKADVEASPQAVITATEKAFRDLIWAKETASASEIDGLATARTATGKEVKVTVVAKEPRFQRSLSVSAHSAMKTSAVCFMTASYPFFDGCVKSPIAAPFSTAG
jgi:hypothetical protein